MLYIGIVLGNWFDTLIKKKSLCFPIISLIYLAWLGGAANPITTMDYSNYELNYNTMFLPIYNSRFEWAYLGIAKIAYILGFSYGQFRLYIVFGIFLILLLTVRRFTNNLAYFVATFSLFPFFNEITQIRSFAMYTLVLLAASFTIRVTKKNMLIASLVIVLSTGFHSSGWFYFIFIVIRILQHKGFKLNSKIILFSIFSTVMLTITNGSNIGMMIARFVGVITNNQASTENITNNFVGKSVHKFFVIEVLSIYMILCFVCYRIMVYILNQLAIKDYKIMDKINALMALVYTGMFGIPLLALSDQYQRFPRFGIEAMIIIVAIYFEMKITILQRTIGMIVTLIAVLIVSFLFYDLPDSTFAQSIPYIARYVSMK